MGIMLCVAEILWLDLFIHSEMVDNGLWVAISIMDIYKCTILSADEAQT